MIGVTGQEPGQAGAAAPDEVPPLGDRTQERWRSFVRIVVTYGVTFVYLAATLYLIWFLTQGTDPPSLEVALGIFAGLSSVATGVIGFWFGNRKSIQDIRAYGAQPLAGAREGE